MAEAYNIARLPSFPHSELHVSLTLRGAQTPGDAGVHFLQLDDIANEPECEIAGRAREGRPWPPASESDWDWEAHAART